MTAHRCDECGAEYSDANDSCTTRFHTLLALDHSRREPWGSRHGQAFAAFALQHPDTYAPSLDAAWESLTRIYDRGQSPAHVFRTTRADHRVDTARPEHRSRAPSVTIADLGDFAAETYAERLDAWCRASLASWAPVP
jgi:hypothetical protein